MEQHRPYLHRQATRRITPALRVVCDPSDFVHQTFESAYAHRDQFRGSEEQLRPWLLRILCRKIADAHRSLPKASGRPRPVDVGPVDSWPGAEALPDLRKESPSQEAIQLERAARLHLALADLPDDQRQALTLRFLDGCSIEEAAGRMGRTRASVAGLLRRGLDTLRGRLHEPF
jgi:RNA polymerase sigma-70 factor (ECF subfamily)